MAYSDVAGKVINNAYGIFNAYLYATVKPGDLIAPDATNDGWILADQGDSVAAVAVAIEGGVAGETVKAALAVEFSIKDTIGSRGVPTATALAASTDVGSPLYTGESGAASGSAGGTLSQVVGYILSAYKALLIPQSYLTGTTMSLSGNASVGGTFAVTGATTLTGALTANGGITVGTGKDLTMTKGNIIFTKGGVQRYVRAITATDTILVNDDILLVTPAADTVLTLPDLATAGIGKSFEIIHKATANTIEVDAAGSDKILGVDGTATYVKCTDDKGIDVRFKLTAVASALWMLEVIAGDVTAA